MSKVFPKISIFWFRRDLRLQDNHGLFNALQGDYPVLPIFIFDENIISELPRNDSRISFIYDSLELLQKELNLYQKSLKIFKGKPIEVWQEILDTFEVAHVYTNKDYEPYAKQRDKEVQNLLAQKDISFSEFKDQVIFEEKEVLSGKQTPYTVFTPYFNKWMSQIDELSFQEFPSKDFIENFLDFRSELPSLNDIGFQKSKITPPPYELTEEFIAQYEDTRDIPSIRGTSFLGTYLRFGTVSIREVCRITQGWSSIFLKELVWRDFYSQVLANFPKVVTDNFRCKYDKIVWRNNKKEFKAWCTGTTGYPIVDAGMRQLVETGYMHNRVRMITASFLVKDLLIDWRWGEAFFAKHLLDYDLASNNGGWQWAAGTGTDAAPYFRIFNPYSQQKKFDPDFIYVQQWVPEFNTEAYPKEIVNHKEARDRTLAAYKIALDENK